MPPPPLPRWGTDAEIKGPLMGTQVYQRFPFLRLVHQNIALHAYGASTYLVSAFRAHSTSFSQNVSNLRELCILASEDKVSQNVSVVCTVKQGLLCELRILASEGEVNQSSVGCMSKSSGGCGHSSGSSLEVVLQTCRSFPRMDVAVVYLYLISFFPADSASFSPNCSDPQHWNVY